MAMSLPALNLGFGSGPSAVGPQEQQPVATFGGARRGGIDPHAAVIISAGIVLAVIIYAATKR